MYLPDIPEVYRQSQIDYRKLETECQAKAEAEAEALETKKGNSK